MSFIIRNISGSAIEIGDIGIYLDVAEEYDLTEDAATAVAGSDDLVDAVNTDAIIVLDPLDDVTPLTKPQSIEAIQSANDTHFRIRGGELTQLDDVDLTGLTDGYQLTYDSGSGNWIPAPPGGTSSGEANTAFNLGTGEGWYAQKVGVELQFKSITAGNAISLTPSTTEINVAVNEGDISHLNITDIGTNTHAQIDSHIANLNNPHQTTVINLDDTNLAGVLDGQAIVYNETTGQWDPYTIVVGGGSGRLIQVLFGPIPALTSTASIPMGPATPLITQGVEIWSATITPTATNSNIRVGTTFSFDFASNNTELIVAFFRDTVCIGTALMTGTTKKFPVQVATTIYDQPNTTSPAVYSCRVGKVTGTTFYINRTQDYLAALGGTLESQAYTVEEIGVTP